MKLWREAGEVSYAELSVRNCLIRLGYDYSIYVEIYGELIYADSQSCLKIV